MEQEGLGQVLGSRSVVRITGHKGREPDLLFLRADRLGLLREQEVAGSPDLVVKIISPGDTERDVINWQAEYEELGVKEYWQIDQPRQVLTVFVRGEGGRFVPVEADEAGRVHSSVLPGFYLRAEWLWREHGKFPPLLVALQEIRGVQTVAAEQLAAWRAAMGPEAFAALLRAWLEDSGGMRGEG